MSHPVFTLDFGTVLPNGARVIEVRATSSDDGIVLATNGRKINGRDEYVTWRIRFSDFACFNGNYFNSLADAVSDYESR